jgi:hypothetical protein
VDFYIYSTTTKKRYIQIMAASPQFASIPQTDFVTVNNSTGGSRTSAASNSFLLITGTSGVGYSGTKVTQIGGKYTTNNPAGLVFIYITDTTGSSASAYLYDEISFTATTPSTTAVSARVINTYTDLQLMPGQSIYVSSSLNASTQSVNVWASAGDF